MDRSVFATCAVVLSPLVALLSGGCESHQTSPSASADDRPGILADLQQASPGPWRRLADVPTVATTLIEDSAAGAVGREASDAEPLADDTADAYEIVHDAEDAPADAAESTLQWANPPTRDADATRDSSNQLPSDEAPPSSAPASDERTVESTAPQTLRRESAPHDVAPLDQFEPALLPWANSQPRSPESTANLRRASECVRRGFQLSGRGALYSARAEFVGALQLIAQSNDTQQSTQFFTKALAAGLVALKESSDFVHQDPRKADVDVGALVARHRTPILKGADAGSLTPMAAAQRYYTFAQEQLAAAASRETAGSMALLGLGKAALVSGGNRTALGTERVAQSMVLFQAALLADPQNGLAANELGVLLAENGSLSRARDMLQQSARLSPQAATWHNLSVVHARLGETQWADGARAQARAMRQRGQGGVEPRVQWVDPPTFAGTQPLGDGLLGPALPPKTSNGTTGAAPAAEKPAAATAKKGITDWLPWNPRR